MPVLQGLALLLLAQSAGEALRRVFGLALPGPVVGLALVLAALALPAVGPWMAARLGAAADLLLAHLSLLFVPLGVGVVAHLALLGSHALALAAIVVLSTAAGLVASAWVLNRAWRDDGPGEPRP